MRFPTSPDSPGKNFGIINKNIYDKKKGWVFYGTYEKYKEVIKEISTSKRQIISWLSNNDNLQSIDMNHFQGIIIEDFSILIPLMLLMEL